DDERPVRRPGQAQAGAARPPRRAPAPTGRRPAPPRDKPQDEEPRRRSAPLRLRGERTPPARRRQTAKAPSGSQRGAPPPAPRQPGRRHAVPDDLRRELNAVAGPQTGRALKLVMDAADAFAHDREREVLRILRPLRDQYPDAPSVRELIGLAQYRLGNYAAA